MKKQTQTKEEKLLGLDTCREIEAMDLPALDGLIVQASASIKQAKEELEANPKYQELKAQLKDVAAAFRDLRKRQNGKIQYALKMREEKGQ